MIEIVGCLLLVVGIVVVVFAMVIEVFCVGFAILHSGAWCVKQIQTQALRMIPEPVKGPVIEYLLRSVEIPESRLRSVDRTPSEELLRPQTDRVDVGGSNEP